MKSTTIKLGILLLCLWSLTTFASQKTDQSLCGLALVGKCTVKCQKTGINDCAQLCKENITNECLYAGE